MIGLALSGGGSRAIAFHLGCLRALHDRNILEKVKVISAVSGGSVIAGMYAYSNDTFDDFDRRVVEVLRRGLFKSSVYNLFGPGLLARIVATNLISRPLAIAACCFKAQPPLRRWASRTYALERSLNSILGDVVLPQVARPNLEVVFNACELRTGSAFRFGNRLSGGSRFGEIQDNDISISRAIACSAAYPMFLPAYDVKYMFVKGNVTEQHRVVLTDGGVYDNLGISCLEPGRDPKHSLHSYPAEYIIACYAGHGQFDGKKIPYGFIPRTGAAFESVFRKLQDAALNRLHMHKEAGNIKGFILPYLGQQDYKLPIQIHDLMRREKVFGYPTNFDAMEDQDIGRISRRGEQLTRFLLGYYCPEL